MKETAITNLFSLIGDVEACSFAYEDVINLFQLLTEELEKTAQALDEDHPYTIRVYNGRFPIMCSLLDAIQRRTVTATKELHDAVHALYTNHTEIKNGDT